MASTVTRNRLEYHARPAEMNASARVMALAALHIGDELRNLTTAINSAANPTEAELDKRMSQAKRILAPLLGKFWDWDSNAEPTKGADRTGECWSCQHWIRDITADGRLGHCALAASPTNTAGVTGKCTGFAKRKSIGTGDRGRLRYLVSELLILANDMGVE